MASHLFSPVRKTNNTFYFRFHICYSSSLTFIVLFVCVKSALSIMLSDNRLFILESLANLLRFETTFFFFFKLNNRLI